MLEEEVEYELLDILYKYGDVIDEFFKDDEDVEFFDNLGSNTESRELDIIVKLLIDKRKECKITDEEIKTLKDYCKVENL